MNDSAKTDASGATPSIWATGLGKTYTRRGSQAAGHALASLDLAVHSGEAVVFVGPNGAGKSTALRLMAGIELPSRGRVRIFEDSPRAMAVRRRIGYLADSSELFPFLDVRETLEFFGAAADLERPLRRERADELIELLGLASYGKKRVHTFSLGMRRRLGLACVLIGRADVLLLDEPISGLDPPGIRLFFEIMQREKERGATIVFSSHHLGHAELLCDRVVVLRRGEVLLQGEVASISAAVGSRELTVDGLDDQAIEVIREAVRKEGGALEQVRISEDGLARFLLEGDEGGE